MPLEPIRTALYYQKQSEQGKWYIVFLCGGFDETKKNFNDVRSACCGVSGMKIVLYRLLLIIIRTDAIILL